MKTFRLITIIILLTSMVEKVSGTAQVPDFMIYNGDTLMLFSNPMEGYFDSISRPNALFNRCETSCWRGYIGYWELKNDSLFLLELHGYASKKIDLSLVFKDRKVDGKIFADWVDFPILNPYGKRIFYEHMGYSSIYEYERKFIFSKGILKDIEYYDNSKSQRCKFTDHSGALEKYIQSNIDYANISNGYPERARVTVELCSVNEDGKIDSVRVMRGYNYELDKEAIRVVKSIPEWDVIYKNGKQIQISWILSVMFNKREWNIP